MEKQERIEIIDRLDKNNVFFNVNNPVNKYLDYVPGKYKYGLKYVIIADSLQLSRSQSRQKILSNGKKVLIADCKGLYYRRTREEPARIELFVNNIINNVPIWCLRIHLIRDMLFASILYHELGHHVHRTLYPEHSDPESVAERWRKIFFKRFMFRNYWYLLPILLLMALIIKVFKKLKKERMGDK